MEVKEEFIGSHHILFGLCIQDPTLEVNNAQCHLDVLLFQYLHRFFLYLYSMGKRTILSLD